MKSSHVSYLMFLSRFQDIQHRYNFGLRDITIVKKDIMKLTYKTLGILLLAKMSDIFPDASMLSQLLAKMSDIFPCASMLSDWSSCFALATAPSFGIAEDCAASRKRFHFPQSS